jgi:hypothetical protein
LEAHIQLRPSHRPYAPAGSFGRIVVGSDSGTSNSNASKPSMWSAWVFPFEQMAVRAVAVQLFLIICSRDRASRLSATLSKLNQEVMRRHQVELVLVDSASEDETFSICVLLRNLRRSRPLLCARIEREWRMRVISYSSTTHTPRVPRAREFRQSVPWPPSVSRCLGSSQRNDHVSSIGGQLPQSLSEQGPLRHPVQ